MSQPADEVRVGIVPDFSGFADELRVGVEAEMRKLLNTLQNILAQVERQASEAGRAIGADISRGGEVAESALREISTTSTTAFNNVGKQASQAATTIQDRLGGALALVRTTLLALGVATGAGLVALTGFGLKAAASLEQTQIAFNSLLGSAAAGQAAFKELQAFAAATPFEFPEVAGAAQRFFAFSGSVGIAKDQVTGFLTTLGNVASVTGGGAQALNSVTLAMGQIASAGKVTLDNLNQISEALPGFSGVAAIASATGKTTAQVMAEISSGSLDATTGINALLVGMQKFPGAAGAMEAQAQTLLGVFSTFKDTFSQALVAGFAPVIPEIKASLTALTPILGEAIGQIAPALGHLVAGLLPVLGQLVTAATAILGPLLAGLGDGLKVLSDSGALKDLGAALGQVAGTLRPLFPLIAKIIVALAQALIPVIEALAPSFAELVPIVIQVIEAFLPLIPSLGELAGSILLLLPPLILVIGAFVRFLTIRGVVPLVELLAETIGFCAEAIGEFAKALELIDWGGVEDGIEGGFTGAWEAVAGFFESIGTWFSELPGRIADGVAALPGVLLSLFSSLFDQVNRAIGFGIGTIVGGFIALPGILGKIITDLWADLLLRTQQGIAFVVAGIQALPGTIWAILVDLWDRAKAIFQSGVDAAVEFITGLGPRLIAELKSLPSRFVAIGGQILDGLIDGIKAGVGRAVATVKRAMGDILAGAKSALGIHSPSLVFATEVGAQIPPGIGEGVESAMPDLHRLLADATAGMASPALPGVGQGAGAAAGALFSPGSIVVNFNGAIPTQQQAQSVGVAVGAGIADSMAKRGIATAVRTV